MGPQSADRGKREAARRQMGSAIQRLRELAVASPFRPVENVNDLFQEKLTAGDYVAIVVARWIGSWSFIICMSVFLTGWAALNAVGWARHWDPYPFVLMSLFLSLQAVYTAPLIMMAQNRDAARDRLMLQEDFETNHQAAEEIRRITNVLEQHGRLLELLLEERWRHPEAGMSKTERSGPAVTGEAHDGSPPLGAPGATHHHAGQPGEESEA